MKSIIDEYFNDIKRTCEINYFPSFYDVHKSDPDNFCNSDSFRSTTIENQGYENMLIRYLIELMCELNDKMNPHSPHVTRQFEYFNFSELKKYLTNEEVESNGEETFDFEMKNRIVPDIYTIFGYDIMFATHPLEKDFGIVPRIDPTFLKHFLKNKACKQLYVVVMKRKIDSKRNYSENCCHPEDKEIVENFLKNNDIKYGYFEGFLKEIISVDLSNYVLEKIDKFNDYTKYLQTEQGFYELVEKDWIELIDNLIYASFFFSVDDQGWNYERDVNKNLYSNASFAKYLRSITSDYKSDVKWISSFVSSETLFANVGFITGADNTFLVAGYLKTIEQLLANLIIKDASLKGYEPISIYYQNNTRQCIEINYKNRNHATLGKIENYIRYSKHFLHNQERRNLLLEKLKPWRKRTRNGYFHKDTIYSYGEISDIRKKTYKLMFLVFNLYYLKD